MERLQAAGEAGGGSAEAVAAAEETVRAAEAQLRVEHAEAEEAKINVLREKAEAVRSKTKVAHLPSSHSNGGHAESGWVGYLQEEAGIEADRVMTEVIEARATAERKRAEAEEAKRKAAAR